MIQFMDLPLLMRWLHLLAAIGWISASMMAIYTPAKALPRLRFWVGFFLTLTAVTGYEAFKVGYHPLRPGDLFLSGYGAVLLLKIVLSAAALVILLVPTALKQKGSSISTNALGPPLLIHLTLWIVILATFLGMVMRRL